MEVANSQWLYRQHAKLITQSEKTVTVVVDGVIRKFWRKNNFQFGYSKIIRRGDEPDRLIIGAMK